MKMETRSRKPRFGGIVVNETRQHYKMAQGKAVKPTKTPGLRGNRKPGYRNT